jgi:hypothetical protein
MTKRRLIIGGYDTAAHGWTLSSWKFDAPKHKELRVEKAAGDGAWDLSAVLSDGIPRYHDRKLTATLERSDGNRSARETEVRDLINALDGLRWDIYLPDDTDKYVTGRVSLARSYSDLAHAAVTLTATCEPWKYYQNETVREITVGQLKKYYLQNSGRRAVVPVLEVEGDAANVRLAYEDLAFSFGAGRYQVPDLLLTPGEHEIVVNGSGLLRITYREAVLE